MKAFKELLKDALLVKGEINVHNLVGRVINWPVINDPDEDFDDDEGNSEPLDLENWDILSISDDKMVMCAGGDWQEPLTFTLTAKDGMFWVDNEHEGYEIGLSNDEILEILSK